MSTTEPFPHSPSKIERVEMKIEEIEREMKISGLWQSTPLPEETYAFTRAFAGDTMAYTQWLQFVFIPRVREVVAGRGDLPATSSVAAQGVRELDGYAEATVDQVVLPGSCRSTATVRPTTALVPLLRVPVMVTRCSAYGAVLAATKVRAVGFLVTAIASACAAVAAYALVPANDAR